MPRHPRPLRGARLAEGPARRDGPRSAGHLRGRASAGAAHGSRRDRTGDRLKSATESKRGQAGTRSAIRRLGVVARLNHPRMAETLERLRRFAEAHGIELTFERAIDETSAPGEPSALEGSPPDLMVALGGDGT